MFAAIVKGCVAKIEREQEGRAWLAWHAGLIGRMKKPPALLELMGRREQLPPVQTEEQMTAVFAAMRAEAVAAR